jgi:hypothetical protein
MRMKRYSLLFICLLTLCGSAALAQTAPPSATTQPMGTFTVQQWAVFVLDATQGELNPNGLVGSTLPEFVVTRRTSLSGDALNLPQPVGIIRLFGKSDSKVDVTIGRPLGGDFLSTWPAAEARSNQMLWRDLTLSAEGPAGVEGLGSANWFASLRNGESDYLSNENGPGERFLLFDITMPYISALKARTNKDYSVQLTNTGKSALDDLMLYHERLPQTWMQASAGNLVPDDRATRPAAATQPSQTTVQLAEMAGASTRELADAWTPRLLKAGLAQADCDMIVSILAANAFDGPRLTAIYRMDEAELERLMPLEAVPAPGKIIRVGLVIVKNADPALGSELDDLIAQLGDPVWAKREQAYQTLKSMGRAAEPKLTQAESDPDPEIAWRAERLLTELGTGNGR